MALLPPPPWLKVNSLITGNGPGANPGTSGNGPSDPANGGYTNPDYAPGRTPSNRPNPNPIHIAGNGPTGIVGSGPRAAGPIPKMRGPKPLSPLEKWLAGDTTYQQQLAEFNQSKTDFNANYNKQTGVTNRDYAETQRELDRQGQQDRMDQQNDFAGRGILHSGVFAKALGDYNTDFNTKVQNLVTGKTDQLGNLQDQRTAFLRELQLQLNAAKQDAIRRRAQTLGL